MPATSKAPVPTHPPKERQFCVAFDAPSLRAIHELAVNEAKRVSDLFGMRLKEFPDVCEHIARLSDISHAAVAALPR